MGKKQITDNLSQTPSKQELIKKKKKCIIKQGRPADNEFQIQFMNLIRGPKIQTMNAQSQLQFEMAFFSKTDTTRVRGSRQRIRVQNKIQQSLQQDLIQQILNFPILSPEYKKQLEQNFEIQRKKWKFIQINSKEDLPKYFFDDGEDFSYILHQHINKKRISQSKQKISTKTAEQLIYLALLCLNSRKILRRIVLDFLKQNQQLLIALINYGIKNKIQPKYIQRKAQQSSLNEQKKTQKNEAQIKSQNNNLNTNKNIKARKNSVKNKQDLDDNSSIQEQNYNLPRTSKEKQDKLIFSFVNFIIWSYFYINEEEVKNTQIENKLQ